MTDSNLEQAMKIMNENWALIRSNEISPSLAVSGNPGGETYLLIWTADETMPDLLLQACRELLAAPPHWPRVTHHFHERPEPGFLIDVVKEWVPAGHSEEEALFNKLIWEIERAKGKP